MTNRDRDIIAWTTLKTARQAGYNVRNTENGWQTAHLSIKGWNWAPYTFKTKARALDHCRIVHLERRALRATAA